MTQKIVRSICYFSDKPAVEIIDRLEALEQKLTEKNYLVQTKRIVAANSTISVLNELFREKNLFIGAGSFNREQSKVQLNSFFESGNISFNLEIDDYVKAEDIDLLFTIINTKPEKTFNFSYTFSNVYSSAFFPAANYKENGFSIGLQPTDLTEGCSGLDDWLHRMKEVWEELNSVFATENDFLGIDSSIAPMYSGHSSLVNLMKNIHGSFTNSVTSNSYVKLSAFIKSQNPVPVGLCGLMFPCLEDFELAQEYENGNFSIERNIFLSLHSGLGIDTYPIGIDESSERVQQLLNLLLSLSKKYNKPLSARFVSDGKARIGEQTDFQNQYLKDIIVRAL